MINLREPNIQGKGTPRMNSVKRFHLRNRFIPGIEKRMRVCEKGRHDPFCSAHHAEANH